ncbi:MAG: ribosome small subunit-dependent GTPase A, partial [Anaerolineae bacterium]|nr:ribosome small subunit-dependent GTPase A [Anaerolineae bacterium]
VPPHYQVWCKQQLISCRLSPFHFKSEAGLKNKKNNAKISQPEGDSNFPVVGDFVLLSDHARDVFITQILPRKNHFSRRAALPNSRSFAVEQIIAANIDTIMPVFSPAHPTPAWHLLDRYLVMAEAAGIKSSICISKADLGDEDKKGRMLDEVIQTYRALGYPLLLTSVKEGYGLDELKTHLQGSTVLLLGKSGVGKTSLINALWPGYNQPVSEVSHFSDRGKHTTTWVEYCPLDENSAIIDSPGVRELGLWGINLDNLPELFPEMSPYLGTCRFRSDCLHEEEPGCAVRQAVINGLISPYRYQSYLKLLEEIRFL